MAVITIDCWGTIIKSSPAFKPSKIELAKRFFPNHDHTDTEIEESFNKAKKQLNDLIEYSGMQPKSDDIFRILLGKLQRSVFLGNVYEFSTEYQKLALLHHPVLYSEETSTWLYKLAHNHTLVLSCNTMFIYGDVIAKTLKKLGVLKFFSTALFSDNMKVAKPNRAMYLDSDWHIGDNVITDGIGAKAAGSTPIIVHSNATNLTLRDAYNIISTS